MASNGNFKRFLNMIAFIGVIAVAVALLISLIFGGNEVSAAFNKVAQIIAYLVTAFYAFYYVQAQRNTIITIVYIIAVVAIIVLLIV